jgi:hypothetical protein
MAWAFSIIGAFAPPRYRTTRLTVSAKSVIPILRERIARIKREPLCRTESRFACTKSIHAEGKSLRRRSDARRKDSRIFARGRKPLRIRVAIERPLGILGEIRNVDAYETMRSYFSNLTSSRNDNPGT